MNRLGLASFFRIAVLNLGSNVQKSVAANNEAERIFGELGLISMSSQFVLLPIADQIHRADSRRRYCSHRYSNGGLRHPDHANALPTYPFKSRNASSISRRASADTGTNGSLGGPP